MSAFSLDADTITEIVAALAALFSCFMATRQASAKKWASAGLWLLGGALWTCVLVFFLTFHIRLM